MGVRTIGLSAAIAGICAGGLAACGAPAASPGHAPKTLAIPSIRNTMLRPIVAIPADLKNFEFGRLIYAQATTADLDKLSRHTSEASVLREVRGVETVSLAFATDTLGPQRLNHHLVWVLVNRHAKEPIFGPIDRPAPSEVDAMAVTLIDASDGSFEGTQMGPRPPR